MKKTFLLLAGSAFILASCGSNNEPTAPTQAQVDSAVNAKLAEHDAENAAKNDSILKAMEAEKAAAMAKETETKTTTKVKANGTKKTTTKTTVTEPATPAPTPPPANAKDSRFNENSGGVKKVDESNTNKKGDRFK